MWLDCLSQREIVEIIGKEYPAFADTTQQTIDNWLNKKSKTFANLSPPDSRQHFDVWAFATADKRRRLAVVLRVRCRRRCWKSATPPPSALSMPVKPAPVAARAAENKRRTRPSSRLGAAQHMRAADTLEMH